MAMITNRAGSGWKAKWGGHLLIAGLPLLLVVAIRLPYFSVVALNEDEGLYAMVARAMQQGGVPYRDAWEHAAPGIFYLYWILFALFGSWNMVAVRVAALVAHWLTGLLVGHAVRSRHGALPGAVAASLTVVSLGGYLALDVVAALTETFLLPFLMAATWLMLKWGGGEKNQPILTGVLLAFAIWFKVHALLPGFLALVGAGVVRIRSDEKETTVLLEIGKTLLAALVTYFLLLLPLILAGGFANYWKMYIHYNFFYLSAGGYGGTFFEGLVNTAWQWGFPQYIVIAGCLAFFLGKTTVRRDADPAFAVLGLGLAAGLVAGILGGRLFGHYFMPAAALAGWIAGEGAARILSQWREQGIPWRSSTPVAGAVVLLAGLLTPILVFHAPAYSLRFGEERDPRFTHPYPTLTRNVNNLLEPGETVWVWGFAPEFYLYLERDTPTRFINCNYLVGLVPWVNVDPQIDTTPLIVPGSWQLLMQDLRERPPAVIIDAAEANFRFWGKYPMRGSPSLTRFVEQHYVKLGDLEGFTVYLHDDVSNRENVP